MRLHEIATKTPFDTKTWLNRHDIWHFVINPDGTVNVQGDVNLHGYAESSVLPVQFRKVDGEFVIKDSKINSLAGCPHTVGNTFSCQRSLVHSIEGMPRRISEDVNFRFSQIQSVSGIHKLVDRIGGIMTLNPDTSHLLGLALIKHVSYVEISDTPLDQIVNKWLNTGDILSFQDELLDAGYKRQAQL